MKSLFFNKKSDADKKSSMNLNNYKLNKISDSQDQDVRLSNT